MSVRQEVVDAVNRLQTALAAGQRLLWEDANWVLEYGFVNDEYASYTSHELGLTRGDLTEVVHDEFFYLVGRILTDFERLGLNDQEGKRRSFAANMREKREIAERLGLLSHERWAESLKRMRQLDLISG